MPNAYLDYHELAGLGMNQQRLKQLFKLPQDLEGPSNDKGEILIPGGGARFQGMNLHSVTRQRECIFQFRKQ